MHPALIKKYWAESWLLWLALALGVILFCWFRVWIVGELDSSQFRQIIDLLPKDWRKFATVDFDWLVSYLGRTALCLDEPMLVMLITAWVIVRGSDVVAGEINRGSMEMLLAQPITRRQVYLTHSICTVAGLIALTLLAWLAMSIGIWTTSVTETTYPSIQIPIWGGVIPLRFLPPKVETIPMASMVNPIMFLPGVISLFCLGVFFAGLAACCSAIDRYRWRTLGIVAGFYFLNATVKILGMASEKWNWVLNFTVFGFYTPARAIERASHNFYSMFHFFERNVANEIVGAGTALDYLILFSLGLVFFIIGYHMFRQRDLPAPV